MLSRIAESLFWIGRYVERADGTARILDVHPERLNHLPMEEQRRVAQELLAVMGARPQSEEFGLDELLHDLAYDKHSATSIAGSLGAARENARRARETVSSGLWESLNTTYYGLNQHRKDVVGTYRFCNWCWSVPPWSAAWRTPPSATTRAGSSWSWAGPWNGPT